MHKDVFQLKEIAFVWSSLDDINGGRDMKSRKQFDYFMSDCCKDSENLICMNRSIENNKNYVWSQCKKCGKISLKTTELKKYEEKESV